MQNASPGCRQLMGREGPSGSEEGKGDPRSTVSFPGLPIPLFPQWGAGSEHPASGHLAWWARSVVVSMVTVTCGGGTSGSTWPPSRPAPARGVYWRPLQLCYEKGPHGPGAFWGALPRLVAAGVRFAFFSLQLPTAIWVRICGGPTGTGAWRGSGCGRWCRGRARPTASSSPQKGSCGAGVSSRADRGDSCSQSPGPLPPAPPQAQLPPLAGSPRFPFLVPTVRPCDASPPSTLRFSSF